MVSFLNKSREGFDLLSGIEGNLDDPTPSSAQEETDHFSSWWRDGSWATVFHARAAQRFPGRMLLPPT